MVGQLFKLGLWISLSGSIRFWLVADGESSVFFLQNLADGFRGWSKSVGKWSALSADHWWLAIMDCPAVERQFVFGSGVR